MGKTKTKSRSVGDSPKPPITIRSTNPKILDDNIAKLEKAIQAGDVSANPSGTAEETLLSTIGIDGKKYELGPSAENTSYDNTDSGLTATDTQAAIDEIAPALTGEGTSYDNTDSGLTADDTQAAIDEIATTINNMKISSGGENTEASFGMFTTEFPGYTMAGVKIRNTSTGRYVIIGSPVAGDSVSVDDRKSIWLYNSWGPYMVKVLGS